jgi:hypothetical protein
MATMTVTVTDTEYTVEVTNGPGDPQDWVGLYQANTGDYYGGYLAWKYMNDTTAAPAEGLTEATLHFPLSAETFDLEFRMYGGGTLLARAPVGEPAAPPIVHLTPAGYISVRDFGATGKKSGDDTQALLDAAAACKATLTDWGSSALLFPPGGADSGVYVASAPIDFRGISTIQAEGAYIVSWGSGRTGPKFKFGVPYATGNATYKIGGFYDLSENYKQRHPLVQFSGLHASTVEINVCPNFVEFYAGGTPDDQTYVGMFFAKVWLGRTYRVELRSEATTYGADWVNYDQTAGWINTNFFKGGQICHFRQGGPWRDVVSLQIDGDNTIVETAGPHMFWTGNLVEMTTDHPLPGQHGLITRLDDTHFSIPGLYMDASLGWRCMGPAGYSANNNIFDGADSEDAPAMFFMNNGHCNVFRDNRMEASSDSQLVFGPYAHLNRVEVGNSTHGRMPYLPGENGPEGERGDMVFKDYAAEDPATNFENFYGWPHLPKPWGSL